MPGERLHANQQSTNQVKANTLVSPKLIQNGQNACESAEGLFFGREWFTNDTSYSLMQIGSGDFSKAHIEDNKSLKIACASPKRRVTVQGNGAGPLKWYLSSVPMIRSLHTDKRDSH